MKKITVIFLITGLVVLCSYLYIRRSLATPGFDPPKAKDSVVKTKPSESFLDLKPKLIEKLQQLVKQGSNGLYNLYIHELKPDLLNATVSISNASLLPDTAVMRQLGRSGELPREIFKIKTDSIWIDGLGLKDILSRDVIDVKAIHLLQPTIEVFSSKEAAAPKSNPKTLYQRLMSQMKHIGIGRIIVHDGTLVCHKAEENNTSRFNHIAANLTGVVIDSTTQFDRNRFLFARDAELTLRNYTVPTSNNLYTFRVGVLSIQATKQLLVAKDISLHAHYGKQEFQAHIREQKERYDLSIPSVEFRNTDWWNLVNNKTLQAESAQINSAAVSVYLDRHKPLEKMVVNGFPHQLIMKLPLKLYIRKLLVNDLNLVYEEFSKLSDQKGKLYVDHLHGTVSNLTNLPAAIRKNHFTTVTATGNFMKVAPVDLRLQFDLSHYQTGAFSAELKSKKGFDGPRINPIAEPLGMFMVKHGELKEIDAHVTGNNYKASGQVLMLYKDLHVTPMKPDPRGTGDLKKKSVTSFIANTFVLKDENPSRDGEVRRVDASFDRKTGTFFNLVWKTTLVGILKTIGAPEKLASE